MVKFKFNKKFELEVVFKKLNSIRKIVDGDVSYEAFEFQELKSLLCSATDGPNNISPIAHDFCISFALGRGSRNLTLSQDEFLGLCSAGLDDFHKKPQVQYLIITSLTSQGKFPFKCIAIDECEIHFGVSPRSKFMLTAVELRKPSEANIQSILPICNSFAHPYCTISVKSRTVGEAYETAIDALDCFRGLMNLCLNTGKGIRLSMGQSPKPINELRLGRLHTVHNLDGSLPLKMFWYDAQYFEHDLNFVPRVENAIVKKNVQFALRAIARSRIGNYAEKALIKYARALDTSDHHSAFRDLWSTLEYLTQANFGTSDAMIKRASNCFEDRDFVVQTLRHLRERRNRIVHHQYTEADPENLLMQLNRVVAVVLWRLVLNTNNVLNHEEFGHLLEIPNERDFLQKKIKILRSAQKYYRHR